jgi:hypothetical protein
MTLIVLVAVGFLACAFFLFVLFQWTRDTKRKTTTVSATAGATSEKKGPQVVGSQRTARKHDRFSGRPGMRERSRGCGPGCNERDRMAYEKVANSLR